MESSWKSERIENILVFSHGIWLGGWKSGGVENIFIWLRREMKNVVCGSKEKTLEPHHFFSSPPSQPKKY